MNDEIYKSLSWNVIKIGKSFLSDFKINNEWKKIYKDLLLYFTGNEGVLDLSKGIYLHGEFGVGKTMTMKIFRSFLAECFPFSPNGFGQTSVEKLAELYKTEGDLLKYGRNNGNEFKVCIDEFGKPLSEKHYGTDIQDVINSMLMVRYELYQDKGTLTHATSNYHPSKLTCFDDALMDRFSEMFNFIEVKGESLR